MKTLVYEDVVTQNEAINFKWDVVRAETSPFIIIIDKGNAKINKSCIDFADKVMTSREKCAEHIVPIQHYTPYYDEELKKIVERHDGICIKCGATCEFHNGVLRASQGVTFEEASNVTFIDLEEIEEYAAGRVLKFSQEEYEKRFNNASKIFSDTKEDAVNKLV